VTQISFDIGDTFRMPVERVIPFLLYIYLMFTPCVTCMYIDNNINKLYVNYFKNKSET